jgi:hypothetical protein
MLLSAKSLCCINFLKIILICVLISISTNLFSQTNTSNVKLKNIAFNGCRTLEFDVWIEWTGTNTQKFQFFQGGINFNYSGLANGGSLTGAFIPGTADPSLVSVQQNPNWNINASSKQIRMLAAIATPSSIASVLPSPPGVRLGRFRITNTVDFPTGSSPNFSWSFLVGSSTTTQSRVAFYLNGATTSTDITSQATFTVESNPLSGCPPVCNVVVNAIEANAPCLNLNNGRALITLSGDGTTSSGSYLLDGVTSLTYSSNPFLVSGLSSGSHSIIVYTSAPCTTSTTSFVISNSVDQDDGNACTVDGCNSDSGVFHTPINADDGDACTIDGCNSATGQITHFPVNIDDNNQCTIDQCDIVTGISHTLIPTSDGNACTDDACNSVTAEVTHTPVNIDDGNSCTTDGCNTLTGVFHTITCQPNSYAIYIKNITYTDCRNLEFDVWLEWTGSNTQKFTFFQAGINFNYSGLASGGTITGAFIPGSADQSLPAVQQAPNWNINASSKQIRLLAAIATPSVVAVVTPPPPGFRLGRFRMTNTVDFSPGASPNFNWSFQVGTSTTTQSRVNFYLNGASTGTDITVQSSHFVQGNPSFSCPPVCDDSLTVIETNAPCMNLNNASALVTLFGDGISSSGTYSLDGATPSIYSNNPFSINGLATGVHSIVVYTTAPCTSSVHEFVISNNADPNDDNPCTNDGCNTTTGVFHTPLLIDDGNNCTTDECNTLTGEITHQPAITDDGNACTIDGCNSISGVFHTPLPADDGNACTIDVCNTLTGQVTNTPVNIDDGNACTVDGCNSSTGIFHTAICGPNSYSATLKNITFIDCRTLEFDILLEWTGTNTQKLQFLQGGINFNYSGLANGGTLSGAMIPNSADPSLPAVQQAPNWNINSTSKQIRFLAAIATPVSVANVIPPPPGFRMGRFRITNTVDFPIGATPDFNWSFSIGTSTTTTSKISCYLNGATTGTDITTAGNHYVESNPSFINACACNVMTSISSFNSPSCINANNGSVTVSLSGVGATFSGTYTLDGNTLPFFTNPFTINGLSSGNHSLFVTTTFPCTSNSINFNINSGANPDDGNPCTIDACSSINGEITHIDLNTDDGNACTEDACNSVSGAITHTPVSMEDGNECTIDGCNSSSGVFHNTVNADDNNLCTTDGCNTLTGVFHKPVDINDQNACTFDGCDSSTGIYHELLEINDNNACTTDGCDVSSGVYHIPVETDDSNACTSDGCNTSTGIYHTPVTTDDGNACTTDGCNPSTGIYHDAIETNDNNACTIDGCNTDSGIFHHPAATDDNNACTLDGCDSVTGIYYHAINIDDNDACTIDGCNTETGIISHEEIQILLNVTTNLILCYGQTTCMNIIATGGRTPYTGDGTFCGLQAGDYTFVVTDAGGCSVEALVSLSQPEKLSLAVSSTPSFCSNSDGTATVSETGGTEPITCIWYPGGIVGHTVTNLAPGNYTVFCTDANGCTSSASADVNITNPTVPTTIIGPTGACRKQSGVVYCTDNDVLATGFIWTIPTGVVISGPTDGPCITLKFTSKFKGGFICVKKVTACGISQSVCKNILLISTKPITPGNISGISSLCRNETSVYSIAPIANGISYQWTVSGNAQILSGQGSTSITILTASNWNGGSVKVKAINCKGTSGARTLIISRKQTCRIEKDHIVNGDNLNYYDSDLNLFPNPTHNEITLSFSCNQKEIYHFRITDLQGKILLSGKDISMEGKNQLEIPLAELSKGIYFVVFWIEGDRINQLILVVD